MVVPKGGTGFVEAFGKIVPVGDARQVKQHGRDAIGGDPGQVAKHDGEHDGGQHRLNEIPEGAQDGLFVLRYDVAAYKEAEQIAVVPDFAQVERKDRAARGDDDVPVFRHMGNEEFFE